MDPQLDLVLEGKRFGGTENSKLKEKMAINKAESKATGVGVFKQQMLSPLEEAVANLLQFEKQISPEGIVQGVPNTEDSVDVCLSELLELETAVANLLQFEKQINPEGIVQGVPNTEDNVDVCLSELLELETAPIIGSKDAATTSVASVPSIASLQSQVEIISNAQLVRSLG